MTTRPNLDDLTRLADAATERLNIATEADAEFIAAARTAVPSLVAALRAVLALHPNMDGECWTCDNGDEQHSWPCPTVRLIEQHVEVDR